MIAARGPHRSDRSGDAASLAAFFWFLRIARAVKTEQPWSLSIYILLFLVSQITLLLALVLPWSILATLSLGESSPRTAMIFDQPGSGAVVTLLMSVVLFCFGLHLGAEAAGAGLCRRAGARILTGHEKLGFSERQRNGAGEDCRRLFRLYAMLTFCVIALAVMAISYPALLILLLLYLGLGARVAAGLPPAAGAALELRGKAWWGLGFLCLVGWVIHDAWRGAMPSFWLVFVALLLARQILIFLMLSASSLRLLWRRREQIEALFLAERPFLQARRRDFELTAFLAPDHRDSWLRPLLAELGASGLSPDRDATRWSERGRIVSLVLRPVEADAQPSLMIRLFHRSITGLGRDERDLLAVATASWPAPGLLAAREIEGHLALIFRWQPACDRAPPLKDRNETLKLRAQLMGCQLPAELAKRYLRSHPRLPDRAASLDWSLLAALSKAGAQAELCARLEACWPSVTEWLLQRPSQIVLPKLTARSMARGPDAVRLICNWTLWQWEPLGYDWPWRARPERELRRCLEEAASVRPEIGDCRVEHVLLVAILASFLERNDAGDLDAVLELLPPLHMAIERAGLLTAHTPGNFAKGETLVAGPARPPCHPAASPEALGIRPPAGGIRGLVSEQCPIPGIAKSTSHAVGDSRVRLQVMENARR